MFAGVPNDVVAEITPLSASPDQRVLTAALAVESVTSVEPDQQVGSGSSEKCIVPGITRDDVVTAIAIQIVVAVTSEQSVVAKGTQQRVVAVTSEQSVVAISPPAACRCQSLHPAGQRHHCRSINHLRHRRPACSNQ